jgi:hypothetical protein
MAPVGSKDKMTRQNLDGLMCTSFIGYAVCAYTWGVYAHSWEGALSVFASGMALVCFIVSALTFQVVWYIPYVLMGVLLGLTGWWFYNQDIYVWWFYPILSAWLAYTSVRVGMNSR